MGHIGGALIICVFLLLRTAILLLCNAAVNQTVTERVYAGFILPAQPGCSTQHQPTWHASPSSQQTLPAPTIQAASLSHPSPLLLLG